MATIGLAELLVIGVIVAAIAVPVLLGGFCVWYFALRKPKQ